MNNTSPGVPGFDTVQVLHDGRSTLLLARRSSDDLDVVVKLLDPAHEPLLPKLLDRRARALTRLARPTGFEPVLASGTAPDGRPYVVTAFHPDGSLQDQLESGPTPWATASTLIANVATSAGRLHAEGHVLADLRPTKILLDGTNHPRIAAYGMASRRFDDGTFDYRAPEVSNGVLGGPPADVYSLTLILGSLIRGQAPQPDEPIEHFLESLEDLAPPKILEIVEHGLAPLPTNRYGDGARLARAINTALDPDAATAAGNHDRRDDDEPFDLDALLRDDRPSPTRPVAGGPGLPADIDDLVVADPRENGLTSPNHASVGTAVEATEATSPDPVAVGQAADDEAKRLEELATTTIDLVATTTADRDESPDEITDHFPAGRAEPSLEAPGPSSTRSDTDDSNLSIVDLRSQPTTELPESELSFDHAGDGIPEPTAGATNGAEVASAGQEIPGFRFEPVADDEMVDLAELVSQTREFIPTDPDHIDDHIGDRGSVGATTVNPEHPTPPPDQSIDLQATTTSNLDPASMSPIEIAPADLAPQPPTEPAPGDDDPTSVFDGEASVDPLNGTRPHQSNPTTDLAWREPTSLPPVQPIDDYYRYTGPRTEGRRILARHPANRFDRLRDNLAHLWFRSRRSVSTIIMLALLAVIAAAVVYFAAREIRTLATNVITDGDSAPSSTVVVSTTFVPPEGPIVTESQAERSEASTTRRIEPRAVPPPTTESTTTTEIEVTPPTTPSTVPTITLPTTPSVTPPTTPQPTPSTIKPSTTASTDPPATSSTRRRRRTTTTAPVDPPTIPDPGDGDDEEDE